MNSKINLDISHAKANNSQISLGISADIHSIADAYNPGVNQPVMRNNRWSSAVLLPLGKPIFVFRSDSLDRKGAMQVTLTATPIH